MTDENREIIGGAYYEAFLISILDGDYSDGANLSEQQLAAFVHERTHYLQNILTLYGLFSSVVKMDLLLQMRDNIRQGTFRGYEYNSDEKDFVMARYKCAAGDSFFNDEMVQCSSITGIEYGSTYKDFYEETYPENENTFKQEVLLIYDEGQKYHFGGEAIKESMAFLFERQVIGNSDYSHRLPYNAAEMLYKYVMGEECADDIILIAICYSSLMSFTPGNTFVSILEKMKSENKELTTMKQVYDIAGTYIYKIVPTFINEIEQRLSLIYPDEPMKWGTFNEDMTFTRKWILDKYIMGIESYEVLPELFHRLFEENDITSRRGFMGAIFDIFGQPLIIDSNGKLYSADEKRIVFMLAPYALAHIILEKKSDCALKNICSVYGKSSSNECESNCWNKESDSTICILRFYLYSIGLGDVKFENIEFSPF